MTFTLDASGLIERTVDKIKSTDGGVRAVWAHLRTLGLSSEFDEIDDRVDAEDIIKIAVAKTMHEE